jgi:hypothetical protein
MKHPAGFLVLALSVLAHGPAPSPTRAQEGARKGTVVDFGGLKSAAPAEWKQEEPTPIQRQGGRLTQFRLAKVGDDKQDAEVLVFHFGGQGGSVADNVKRWKGMFVPPQGKTIDDVAKLEKIKVGDVPVTTLDVEGTYKFKKAPFVPDEQAELRPNYRMVAVYFDHKDGPYFLRFVGPARTVAHYKKGFDEWLKGFK